MSAIVVVTAQWNIFSVHLATSRWVMSTDAAPTDAHLTDMANAVNTAFAAHKSWLSSSSAFIQAYSQVVEFVADERHGHRFHPLGIQHFGARVDSNGTGSASGSSPQVAGRITLQTAVAGRSYRGRMFMPGIPEDGVTAGGTWDATQAAAAKAFVDAAGDGIETADAADTAQWVVPSFKNATLGAVVSTLARGTVGTQRRRLKHTDIP